MQNDRRGGTATAPEVGRRAVLGGMAGVCGGLATAVCPLPSQAQQIAPIATRERPQPGDAVVRADDAQQRPLRVADVPLGQPPIIAWPLDPASRLRRDGSRLNKVLVLRLDPAGCDAPTRANAADGGVLAYSAICPHTGCEVTNWLAATQILECPCHFSHYDPKLGAKVVSGPSPRRLAALPLTAAADGRLTVAKPFIGRLGVQQQS
jgi:rieske iron-sulfur protein